MGEIKIDSTNLATSLLEGFVNPKISAIIYPTGSATDPAGGETVTVKGTGFKSGATVRINGVAVGVTTVVDFNTITFTTPAKTAGNYTLSILNSDGGLGTSASDLVFSGAPTWSTSAGSLGSAYETSSLSTNLSANSDSAVTFSLASGTLPAGATLASNGLLSGTLSTLSNSTTYNFTIAATDVESQSNTRSFSYTVNPDVVSFSTTNNITISTMATSAIAANTMVATSAAGKTISYSVNSLPTGISINATSGAITGTPTTSANSITLVTATADTTNKTASITVNFNITPFVAQSVSANYLVVAGGGGGGNNNNVSAGGGGGGYIFDSTDLYASLTYTVVVGAGGPVNTSGSNSSIVSSNSNLGVYAIGGGYGGYDSPSGGAGGSGGSGGGAGSRMYINFGASGNRGTSNASGQGYDGGSWSFLIGMISNPTYYPAAAGGGGAGGAGGNSSGSGNSNGFTDWQGGAGGPGKYSNISGSNTAYAGGGGGGVLYGNYPFKYPGDGGVGGGGRGAGGTNNTTSLNAGVNTGGGGGGSGTNYTGAVLSGTAGGSGIVIVSYPGSQLFTGGTITTVGSNTVHTFTSSGSLAPL